jgi:hypothetical protein
MIGIQQRQQVNLLAAGYQESGHFESYYSPETSTSDVVWTLRLDSSYLPNVAGGHVFDVS